VDKYITSSHQTELMAFSQVCCPVAALCFTEANLINYSLPTEKYDKAFPLQELPLSKSLLRKHKI